MADTSESPAAGLELRLLLLGLTGSGRSSSGNTILGRSAFWTDVSPLSVTGRSQRAGGVVEGRSLRVIDTPGLFHSCMRPDELWAELKRGVALADPHVLLLLLRADRVTPQSLASLHWISAAFGPHARRFTILLLTWGDALGRKPAEDYLKESSELWEFVSQCAGGFHVFDNTKGVEERAQVQQLLEKVDQLLKRNAGEHYSADLLQEAETHTLTHPLTQPGDEGRAQRLFWLELLSAMGRGAAEATGILETETQKKKGKKVKAVTKMAAIASTPLSVCTAARAVGGAVREGARVLSKHKSTLLH